MLRSSPTPRLLQFFRHPPIRPRQPPLRRKTHSNANSSSKNSSNNTGSRSANPTSSSEIPPKKAPYITRLLSTLSRTSRFLLPPRLFSGPLARLRAAPASHLLSFLILHELTAVLPIVGLMLSFRYFDIVPTSWVTGPWAAWALEGLGRYAGYVRKKGWFGLGKDEEGEEKRLEGELRGEQEEEERGKNGNREVWGWFAGGKKVEEGNGIGEENGVETTVGETTAWQKVKSVVTFGNMEEGYKTWIQLAAAYTITKLLLPVRIGVSLWATPYGARVITAFWKRVKGSKR